MIKELRLIDWKSFADARLYLDPLTILIGSNASGKSNCLDALLFLHRISQGIDIFPAIAGDMNISPLRGGIEWICRKPKQQFTLSLIFSNTEEQDYQYDLTVQVHGAKAEVLEEQLSILTYGEKGEAVEEKVFSFDGIMGECLFCSKKYYQVSSSKIFLSHVESFPVNPEIKAGARKVLSSLQKIFVFDPIPSKMRDYTQLSEKLLADGSNIAGFLAGFEQDKKVELEKTLTSYLKNLPERDIKKIWTELIGRFQIDAMLYCEEGWEGQESREVDARSMSDGTLRYLAIVTALLTREKNSLLVIEEVDNGLHPSRAKLLVDMLKTLGKEREIDILVTTHNPALLDALGWGMVPFIVVAHRDDANGSSRLTQLEDLEQLPKILASDSLGGLSSKGRIEAALKQEGKR